MVAVVEVFLCPARLLVMLLGGGEGRGVLQGLGRPVPPTTPPSSRSAMPQVVAVVEAFLCPTRLLVVLLGGGEAGGVLQVLGRPLVVLPAAAGGGGALLGRRYRSPGAVVEGPLVEAGVVLPAGEGVVARPNPM